MKIKAREKIYMTNDMTRNEEHDQVVVLFGLLLSVQAVHHTKNYRDKSAFLAAYVVQTPVR